jgi:hypothetical protein
MKRFINSTQRNTRILSFTFDGVSNANAITGPDKNAVAMLSDVGTGSWTFTINKGFAITDYSIISTSITDKIIMSASPTTASTFAVKGWNDAGSAADAKFAIILIGSDVNEYYKE